LSTSAAINGVGQYWLFAVPYITGYLFAFQFISEQICLDPAYYFKAHIAKDKKTMIRSFVFGGILFWMPVAIISSFVIGYVAVSKDINLESFINRSIAISTSILQTDFGPGIQLLFGALVFIIGITSIIHGLVGIQSIFTMGYYKDKIKPEATEAEQIKFGRTVTFLVAGLCAMTAISLEKVSLLTIDTFSGIFFAATCGGIFAGFWSGKILGNKVLVSIVMGVLAGISAWIAIDDPNVDWLYGSFISFGLPNLFLGAMSLATSKKFNFAKLIHFGLK
jgi:Na+/proline symporter